MAELLEAVMVVCFGLSWPMSIVKAYTARTAKGKSLFFLVMIFIGYLCGIAAKWMSGNITYVLFFYILNVVLVGAELVLYVRNRNIDRQAEAADDEKAHETSV